MVIWKDWGGVFLNGVNGMGCVEIPEEGVNMNAMVEKFERDLVMKALGQSDWVKSKAARLLSIKRTTLIEKMKRMNIATPVFI